jgi:hypothetical protein
MSRVLGRKGTDVTRVLWPVLTWMTRVRVSLEEVMTMLYWGTGVGRQGWAVGSRGGTQ